MEREGEEGRLKLTFDWKSSFFRRRRSRESKKMDMNKNTK